MVVCWIIEMIEDKAKGYGQFDLGEIINYS